MEHYNVKADEYISKAAGFAKPVLTHIRQLVHKAIPEVEEVIKWGHVHFDYKGPVCHMAAFKQHCAVGFWKQALLPDTHGLFSKEKEDAMGSLGRITSLDDLPPDDQLMEYIQNAVKLNDQNLKVARKTTPKPEIAMPGFFADALAAHPQSNEGFGKLTKAARREYLEWLTDAKTEATRQKRLQQTLEWVAEGKVRNWKYQ